MDYVDIVYCHRYDYDTPMLEICQAMSWIVDQGLAHYWGTSTWPSDMITAVIELCKAHKLHPPVAEQSNYSLLVRDDFEEQYRRVFGMYKYGATIYSPLAQGLLTGKYNGGTIPEDSRFNTNQIPWFASLYFTKDKKPKNLEKLIELENFAKTLGVTMAQLSLAWAIASGDVSSCILGFSKLSQVTQNLETLRLYRKWSPDIEKKIRQIMDNDPHPVRDQLMNWRDFSKLPQRRDLAVQYQTQEAMEWEPSQATSVVEESKNEPTQVEGEEVKDSAPSHPYEYDLFVIGGGSGGISAARWAGKLGKKIAIADFVKPSPAGTKWGLGGTCVNVGCIPKKLMHQAGLLNESKEDMKNAGVSISEEPHDWKAMVTTINKHIKTLNWGYKTELIKAGAKYFNSYARFYDSHTLYLDDGKKQQTVTADKIIIACGGRPSYPDIPGAKEFGISSDDIFWKKETPGKTLVIGASYVALECGGFLNSIGTDTTIMVRSILLRGFDQDMAGLIGKHMEENGINFINGATPEKLEKPGDKIIVTFKQEGEIKTAEYDTVLFAIGRYALTEGLQLSNAGIVSESNGKIKVSDVEQTNVENIYAVGDVQYGNMELTPVAIKTGRLLANRLFGGQSDKMDYVNVPTTVFTPLEYGCCGLTEEEAIKKYGDENVDVYHQKFKPLEWTFNKKRKGVEGYTKVIVNNLENQKIVGFHILSPNAGDITQGVGIAMKGDNFNKHQLDSCIGIHPTVAEDIIGLEKTKKEEPDASKGSC